MLRNKMNPSANRNSYLSMIETDRSNINKDLRRFIPDRQNLIFIVVPFFLFTFMYYPIFSGKGDSSLIY